MIQNLNEVREQSMLSKNRHPFGWLGNARHYFVEETKCYCQNLEKAGEIYFNEDKREWSGVE